MVEVVRLNFPAWPRAWLRAEPFVDDLIDRLAGDSPAVIRFCRTMVEYLGEFEPGYGTTTLTSDGGLVFRFEIAPRRPDPAPIGL